MCVFFCMSVFPSILIFIAFVSGRFWAFYAFVGVAAIVPTILFGVLFAVWLALALVLRERFGSAAGCLRWFGGWLGMAFGMVAFWWRVNARARGREPGSLPHRFCAFIPTHLYQFNTDQFPCPFFYHHLPTYLPCYTTVYV